MRILHAPTNIAGQPYVVSRALRRLGHQSDVLVTEHHPFGYAEDIVFDHDRLPMPWRQLRKAAALARIAATYDVFHFYYGESLLAARRDVPMLRRLGKRIIFHFRGCDIRLRGLSLVRPLSTCIECPAPCRIDPGKEALREEAWRLADRVLVVTPDLLESVPGAELVGQAIDIESWPDLPPKEAPRGNVVVLHAPSDPLIKGTRHVEAAVERLRARGYPVELRLLTRVPHAEIRRAFAEADIVVDQVHMGWYGNFSIEAMASRRPVVAYIRPDLAELAGHTPPIESATPDTLEAVLASLIERPGRRRELAIAGREHVERVHAADRIAERLVECYTGRAAR